MDKKSIIVIVIISLLFFGFMYYVSSETKRHEVEVAKYEYKRDSIANANRVQTAGIEVAAASSAGQSTGIAPQTTIDGSATNSDKLAAASQILGESLAAAMVAQPEIITIENDVLAINFSSRGGQIKSVVLKDFTKYAPKGERNELVSLFDPATAEFGLSFYVKGELINSANYTFKASSVTVDTEEQTQTLKMQLPISADSYIEYVYHIYNGGVDSRDYLVDFDVNLVNMDTYLATQNSIGVNWANTSYQNEKGFSNENRYTTISYHLLEDESIDELSMNEESEGENIDEATNWIAFKQQFFSSILITEGNFTHANLAFETGSATAGFMKNFSAQLAVPYNSQTEKYDFSLYFGPNQYNILNKLTTNNGEKLYIERLIPLGWGIFGWVNRWFVIPLFDFLRQYIGSFGIIIFILAVLVKLIISPMTYKSYVSMAKMRLIKPQVDELTKKYPNKDDAMKRQKATMDLYKKTGINPMGGCIPMLVQMPIIIAMFNFFPASIELRDQSFLWADDLSSYDSIATLPFDIPFYGDHVSLFAILMAVALFGFSYVSYQQNSSSQPQMAGMKFMMVYLMPFMMLFWFNSSASGLCYYYFLANILTIGQTLVIRRMVDDTKIQAVMSANASKGQNKKKSKFQLRYEELMAQQEKSKKKK